MVIALLLCLAGTVATGIVAYGEHGKGLLAADSAGIATTVRAEESEARSGSVEGQGSKGEKSVVGELHGVLANITLALVILHVLGVGVASYAHRENLIAAMVNGRTRAAE